MSPVPSEALQSSARVPGPVARTERSTLGAHRQVLQSLWPESGQRKIHWTPAMTVAVLMPKFSPAVPAFEMW